MESMQTMPQLETDEVRPRRQLPLRLMGVCALVVSIVALFSTLPSAPVDSVKSWAASHQLADLTGSHQNVNCPVCPSADSCPPAPVCTDRSASSHANADADFASVDGGLPATVAAAQACDVDRALLKKYGRHSIKLSRAHEGSGFRVQELHKKLRRGEKVKVAVIGGSVSVGHGFLTRPNEYGAIPQDKLWFQEIVRYLKSTYTPEQVEWVNGAKAATDTGYFSWCYTAAIGTDADLVLVEMAVNDGFDEATFDSSETLIRSLLDLPRKPAVIYVDSFALQNARGKPLILNGGDAHAHLAPRYDVPSISLRAAALNAMMAKPALVEPFFHGDRRHIAQPMHTMLGSMVVAYLQEEGCRLDAGGWEAAKKAWGDDAQHVNLPGMSTLGEVPKNRINEPWDRVGPAHATAPPTCRLASPAGSEYELVPIEPAPSWVLYDWKFAKFYIQTSIKDAEPIRFSVDVLAGSQGTVALGYLRSKEYHLGKIRCEVAGQEAVLDGYWNSNTSLEQVGVIAKGLKKGRYTVTCQTLPAREQRKVENHWFRIMSLMSV